MRSKEEDREDEEEDLLLRVMCIKENVPSLTCDLVTIGRITCWFIYAKDYEQNNLIIIKRVQSLIRNVA